MINGCEVLVGDKVYDIVLGSAVVIAVELDGAMTVRYPTGNQQRFSTGGMFGSQRRLYWANPFIIDPKKEDLHIWPKYIDMVKGVYDLVRGFL